MILLIVSIQLSLSCLVPFCETCSSFSPYICINCFHSFQRNREKGCIPTFPIPPTSYIPIENCEVQPSNLLCTQCKLGFRLENKRCSPICLPDCSCFNPFECIENHSRLLKTACSNPGCQLCCDNSISCCECASTYELSSGTCIESYSCTKDSNCDQCNSISNSCGSCLLKFQNDNGRCIACTDPHCLACSKNTNICESCEDGYSINSSSYNCTSSSSSGGYTNIYIIVGILLGSLILM